MSVLHQLFLGALRETQFMPSAQLMRYQTELLEGIARHARHNVPFYRDRLAPVFSDDRFQPERWRDVPVITRTDVLANAETMYADKTPPDAGRYSEYHTSGTTGERLHFRASDAVNIASQCQSERMWEAFAIDRSAHYASIRLDDKRHSPYPMGSESVGWNKTCPWSRFSSLAIATPVREQVEWLLRRRPRYLSTNPSNAVALAQHVEANGQSLALAAVFTTGESVAPEIREDVARVFGCPIIDNYGATEVGYIAFQCPGGDGYHIAAESVLLELLDAADQPVKTGDIGRVVVTSLLNFAMPFIRYAVGDYAVGAEEPCSCGRTLPRLAGIAGRQRSVFTFVDGTQRSPWGFRMAFVRALKARQIQIVQLALDVVEIRYVPREGVPSPDPDYIQRLGRERFHPSVTVQLTVVAEIPRLPSGKIEDCVSLVTPAAMRRSDRQ